MKYRPVAAAIFNTIREVCSVIYCDDTECQYHNRDGCTAPEVHHSTDRFCTTGRRKPKDDHAELMRAGNPNCHKDNGKWKSNSGKVLR